MNKEIEFTEEDTIVADTFVEDINRLVEHLNKVIISHNAILEEKVEKENIIDEAIDYIKENLTIESILNGKTTYCINSYSFDYEDLLEILERGKDEQ